MIFSCPNESLRKRAVIMPALTPKASVIIPVYNVEQYLEDCLESVLSQTFKEIEIICVNDGSTDKSLKILERYGRQDQRIKVLTQKNQGLSAARNAGLREATGKYISFLDSDDLFADQDVLFALYTYAEQMQTDLICTDLKVKIEIDRQFGAQFYKRKNNYVGLYSGQRLFCEMVDQNDFFNLSWLLFMKREWLSQNNITFYPGILYEDILFSFLCYMNADRAAYLKKECYIYRVREHSIMNKPLEFQDLNSYLVCYREILREAFLQNWTDEALRAIKKYLDLIYYNIKRVAEILYNKTEYKRFTFQTAIDEILASSFEIDLQEKSLNKQIYFDGFNDLLRKSEKIIIYGAGQVGLLVYRYLQYNNWQRKVECFCVTSQNYSEKGIEGAPVKCIKDQEIKKNNALLVIAVRKNYQKEMLEIVSSLGYQDVVVIDYKLEQMMETRVGNIDL